MWRLIVAAVFLLGGLLPAVLSAELCRAGSASIVVDGVQHLTATTATSGTLLNISIPQFVQVVQFGWNIAAANGNVKISKTITPLTAPGAAAIASVSNSTASGRCNITFNLGGGYDCMLSLWSGGSLEDVLEYDLSLVSPPTGATDKALGLMVWQNIDNSAIFGGGEQYNTVDLRGRVSVVFTREQGVGRGLQPLTSILNLYEYSGGSEETNYAARPILASRDGWIFIQENPSYSELDLTLPGRLTLLINDTTRIRGWIGRLSGPAAAVSTISLLVGRPPMLPAWSYSGAIVGMQGGTAMVLGNFSQLLEMQCPMAAFWLQDWTGVRQLDARQGLWWNWRWNATHYPNYTSMIQLLASYNVRTMTYLNPMLVPDPEDNAMYNEALTRGYFIRCGEQDEPWVGYNGASMIDFTNPNATAWYQGIIEQAIESGVSGWMADFGESVPLDAHLFDETVAPSRYHNEYPDQWFAVNRQAAIARNKSDDVFFFGRSAWLRSASLYSAAWSGDQLCNFDDYDGIGSAVTSLITSGLSGALFQHSDIGGYNAMLWYRRTEELFLRWCELSAFSTIFRSHDGSDPHSNWQFYSSSATMKQFSRYARLFMSWHFYRSALVAEAVDSGLPVVRPLFLHYPDDDEVYNLTAQYLVGSELLVAPVTRAGAVSVPVVVPRGSCWVNIWTNQSVSANSSAPLVFSQPAPIGCPAVFVRCQSPIRAQLFAAIATADVTSECVDSF